MKHTAKGEGGEGGVDMVAMCVCVCGAYLFDILQPNLHVVKTFAPCEVVQHKYALKGASG